MRLFSLPLPLPPILLLYPTQSLQLQQPNPDDTSPTSDLIQDTLVRRHAAIEQRLARQPPVAVRKMPADAGEKFWLDYWIFDGDGNYDDDDGKRVRRGGGDGGGELWTNSSLLSRPFPLHADADGDGDSGGIFGRSLLTPLRIFGKRGFQCPAGTEASPSTMAAAAKRDATATPPPAQPPLQRQS
ncbi:hypothetical protein FQN53_001254 [Emmonsiellopsis sp. PD_33]|nr:hypothetical protein FQN53_001254 [Emmonsiellopsis sp. PD_33]